MPEVHQRMSLYKRVSQVRRRRPEVGRAWRRRSATATGAFPPEVETLLGYAALRLRAEALGVVQVDLGGGRAPPAPGSGNPARRGDPGGGGAGLAGGDLSPAGVLRAPLAAGRPALVALGEVLGALEGVLEAVRIINMGEKRCGGVSAGRCSGRAGTTDLARR